MALVCEKTRKLPVSFAEVQDLGGNKISWKPWSGQLKVHKKD